MTQVAIDTAFTTLVDGYTLPKYGYHSYLKRDSSGTYILKLKDLGGHLEPIFPVIPERVHQSIETWSSDSAHESC
jgi:hypothetical protein